MRLQNLETSTTRADEEYMYVVQRARQDFADQRKSLGQADPDFLDNLRRLLGWRERLEEERRELVFLRSFRRLEARRHDIVTRFRGAAATDGVELFALERELLEILRRKERLMDEEVYQGVRRKAEFEAKAHGCNTESRPSAAAASPEIARQTRKKHHKRTLR